MKQSFSRWMVIGLVIAALLVGVIGGGVLGGVIGYTVAGSNGQSPTAQTASSQQVAQATQTPTPTQPATTPTSPSQSSGATANSVSTQSYDQIVAKVNPAVVTVTNTLQPTSGAFGQSSGGEAIGTGMIIDKQGHIVTNAHVVDGAQSLKVTFSDGKTVPATLAGADAFQDIAVIKVDVAVPATVTFGDSSKLQPGQRVIAIGSALGQFNNTVTDGIVSAINRNLDTSQGYVLPNLVQHDAPINEGNSGGPLINLDGQVVGMNTAKVTNAGVGQVQATGLSFAIESNVVKSEVEQLIANGKIDRPYLGISFQPAQQTLPGFGHNSGGSSGSSAYAVQVMQVQAGSPAAKAGLQVGDIITGVNGTTFDDQKPFLNTMYTFKPGDTVTLQVQSQDGSTRSVKVTLGNTPSGTQ